MRILLIGEFSNVHATLAKGFRKLGHEVTVVSNGNGWRNYDRDISMIRGKGRRGALGYMARLLLLLPKLRGYDVVQIVNPLFFELKAKRLKWVYDYLHRHNGKIFLGAYGDDWYWVSTCTEQMPLRYSDFNIGSKLRHNRDAEIQRREWMGTDKEWLCKHIANTCNGIIACLYEYYVCYERYLPHKSTFIPLPIVPEHDMPLSQHNYREEPIKIFIGIDRDRSEYKGTDIMLQAANEVKARHPERMELVKVESVPFMVYQHLMDNCDAILDQLYSYTPSMNPLLAMSKGIICIGGGEQENYDIINEHSLHPIINVLPNRQNVCDALEWLVNNPDSIDTMKRQSIEYVKKHHDYIKVAKLYIDFYNEH